MCAFAFALIVVVFGRGVEKCIVCIAITVFLCFCCIGLLACAFGWSCQGWWWVSVSGGGSGVGSACSGLEVAHQGLPRCSTS